MFSNAEIKTRVDASLATITHIGYSEDGSAEISTSDIARTAVSSLGGWTTPSAADPYAPANTSAGDSATNSGATHNPAFWAGFTAATAGTRVTEWIPNTTKGPFFATMAVSGNLITAPGHSLVDTDTVRFYGPNLPAAITAGTLYYVKTGSVSGNTFTIATVSNGGTVVTIAGAGSGTVLAVQSIQIVNGGKISHAAGALVPAKVSR
jgi:hypothetical protein